MGGCSAISQELGTLLFIYFPMERSQLVLVNHAILQQGDNTLRDDSLSMAWAGASAHGGSLPSPELLTRKASRRSHDSSWPFHVLYRDKYFYLQFWHLSVQKRLRHPLCTRSAQYCCPFKPDPFLLFKLTQTTGAPSGTWRTTFEFGLSQSIRECKVSKQQYLHLNPGVSRLKRLKSLLLWSVEPPTCCWEPPALQKE